MSEPLDECYLRWLYSQIGNVRTKNPSKTHWTLIRQLYTKEFVWFIPNDDNRIGDGKELRYEFFDGHPGEEVDAEWLELGCSMLEMLIGLSRRLSFEAEGEPLVWFWHLLETLHLHGCTDQSKYDVGTVDDILDTVIFRTYEPDGNGGLFPLLRPPADQRKVEIWYQMSEYLLEHN